MKPFLISIVVAITGVAHAEKPNIVLIMCDDLGFSDLSCYGSEINTPHIDALADKGVRFSQFKNAGRCCPSRAALMTGRDQHAVGMGWMTALDEQRPGYRGQITDAVPTLAEVLKANGYETYLSGKWHLTVDSNFKNKKNPTPNGSWPVERGFDQSYGGLSGGGGYYETKGLVRNTTPINQFPKDYYYTTAITEHAVSFIEQHDPEQPLFLYIAHYAPHRPLQAPKSRVDACRDRYRVGYDVLREKRYANLKTLGIVQSDEELPVHQKEFWGKRPEWNALKKEMQQKWITEMSTYAAMVEMVDDGVGEVVEQLKKKGLYENTVFFFLSDNGATSEGGTISQLAADLSNTPYRSYKRYMYEGGVSSPLIVHWPKMYGRYNGAIRHDRAHILDIFPTCLELAGIDYPQRFKESTIPSLDGVSLVPAVEGTSLPDRIFFYEHETSAALVSKDWKIVFGNGRDPWELINLKNDPFEQRDVAKQHPEIVQRLEEEWNRWAENNQVLPRVNFVWMERIKHFKKLNGNRQVVE